MKADKAKKLGLVDQLVEPLGTVYVCVCVCVASVGTYVEDTCACCLHGNFIGATSVRDGCGLY